jgi:hypothetical protein
MARPRKGNVVISNPDGSVSLITKGEHPTFIRMDKADIVKLQGYAVAVNCIGYAVVRREGRTLQLHRLLLDAPPNVWVDHVNGDKLDNRRLNIRFCSPGQNAMNKGMNTNNTSGHKGIDWRNGKWRASIRLNTRRIHLGYFIKLADAIAVRTKVEVELFGTFARKVL